MMISIILPVHNGEKYLLRALESISKQKVHKELVVIDDFSSDMSMKIVKGFAKNVQFSVRIFSTAEETGNKTPTGAPNIPRNIGANKAKGEYLALIDQDDWWEDTKLEEQASAIAEYHADICSTAFVAVNETTGKRRFYGGRGTGHTFQFPMIFMQFLRRDRSKHTLMSTLLFKKKIWPQMDEQIGLTDFLWTAKLLEDRSFVCIDKFLTNRGVTGDNTSYRSHVREVTLYEQLMVMSYYSHKYDLDLDASKAGCYASYARYCYQCGEYRPARKALLHARPGLKNAGYFLTSFIPKIAEAIKKRFPVWGDN